MHLGDSWFSFRRNLPIDLTGMVCATGYLILAFLARRTGEPGLVAFYGIVVWTALPTFVLFLYLTNKNEPLPFSRLIVWAIVFRLCGLFGGPIYEDDFFRYLWDGYRFWTDGTPYGTTPERFFLDASVPLIFHAVLDQINNPDLPTIYGPTTQLVFLASYFLKAGDVIAVQSLLIAVDVLLVYLLTKLTSAKNVMLYAWSPLVVKEIAFTAHPDGIGICLLVAAIVLITRKRPAWSAICLGLAVGAKVFALALVPFVLRHAKLWHWLLFAMTLTVLYLPFVVLGSTELDSLIVFAREWEFNAAIFGLMRSVFSPTVSKLILAAIGLSLWLWWYLQYNPEQQVLPRGDHVYGLMLIVAPVINPWYVLWILPFAAIYPSRWAWTASVAVMLAYVTGLNLGNLEMQAYELPMWVPFVEFGAIGIALLWDMNQKQSTLLKSN